MEQKMKTGLIAVLLASITTGGGYFLFERFREKEHALKAQQFKIEQLAQSQADIETELQEQTDRYAHEKKQLEDLLRLKNSRGMSNEVNYTRKIESLEQELNNVNLDYQTAMKRLEQALRGQTTDQVTLTEDLTRQQQLVAQLRSQLQTHQQTIEDLRAQRPKETMEGRFQALEQRLIDREQKIAAEAEKNRVLTTSLAQHQETIAQLTAERDEQHERQAALKTLEQRIGKREQEVETLLSEAAENRASIAELNTQLEQQAFSLQDIQTERETQQKKAQEKQAALEQALKELSVEKTRLYALLQSRLSEKGEEESSQILQALEQEITQLSQKLREATQARQQHEEQAQESLAAKERLIVEKDVRIQELLGQISENKSMISGLETRIQEIKSLLSQIAENRSLEERIIELTSLIQEKETDGTAARQEDLLRQIRELTSELEKTRTGLSFQEKIAQLTEQLTDAELEKSTLRSQLQTQTLESGARTQERERLNAELLQSRERQKAQADELALLSEQVRDRDELAVQLANVQDKLVTQERQLAALKDSEEQLQQQLERKTQEWETLQQKNVTDMQALTRQLAEKQEALAEAEKTLQTERTAQEEQRGELQASIERLTRQQTELTASRDVEMTALQENLENIQAQLVASKAQARALEVEKEKLGQQKLEFEQTIVQAQQNLNADESRLNEYQTKISWLEADLKKQEAEYLQLKQTHDQALNNLKAEIEGENLAKTTIQARLQEELDRSNATYQQRLDMLAAKKEEEIEQLKSLTTTYEKLVKDLQQEIDAKSVTIEQFKERLTVKIVNRILFPTGSADVNEDGLVLLNRIGALLKQSLDGRQIRVEGHTDSRTIGPDLMNIYPTNWELSMSRAVNVVRYLQEKVSIEPSKLYAVGYGPYRPVATNDTEEGRSLNRRIEVVLTPELEKRPLHE